MSVYDKGYRAYFRRKSLGDNPFEVNTPDHARWISGWTLAQEDYWTHGIDPGITVDARELGYQAYFNNHPLTMNPYLDGIESLDWTHGWEQALSDAEEMSCVQL